MNEFEELYGERDAAELARIAKALDVSAERGPRAEFVARLRGRLERETSERRLRQPSFGLPRLRPRWVASLAAAVVLAVVAGLGFPQTPNTSIGLEQRLVLASVSGFVAYDPVTLQEKERVNVPAPEPWVMLARDQRTLVFTFGSVKRQMRVLDFRSPSGYRNVEPLNSPHQFALSRDGSRAYVRDGDAIRIVDVPAARVIASLPTPGIEDSPVYLAPDDRRLIQFRPEGELVVFDVVERRELRRVPIDLHDIQGTSASARVAFSPDGTRLYAVGSMGSPTGPVRLLVLEADSLAVVADQSIDPDSAPSLSHGPGRVSRLDDLLGELGFIAEAKELGTVTQIALSPDGRTLYAARGSVGSGILVVDTQRLAALGRIQSGRSIYGLQLSPDGSRLFALAGPTDFLGNATLVAVDARSYGAVATASIRGTGADSSVIIYKP